MVERMHREAIYSLERKLMEQPTCSELIKSWISSYHLLAECYKAQGDNERAMKCLLIPHHSMAYMAKYYQGDQDTEVVAMSALKLTLPPILEFAEHHPLCEGCMQELELQQKSLYEVTVVYH